MTLTYLDFLAMFVVVPLSMLTIATVRQRRATQPARTVQVGGIALLVTLALVYTIPWDSHLILEGVWWYGDGRVTARFLRIPVEEYAFIVLQTVFVGVWTFSRAGPVDATIGHSWRDRALGLAVGGGVGLAGVLALAGPQSFLYLGSILVWASPILALQWAVGWRYLGATRRRVLASLLPPVAYLAVVDRIAIAEGIWALSPTRTTGVTLAGLPVEELIFFLVTSLFVVQALVLLRWVIAKWG
jgi:lycopene cyclase domain-containing protein